MSQNKASFCYANCLTDAYFSIIIHFWYIYGELIFVINDGLLADFKHQILVVTRHSIIPILRFF